jgi:hypothetical protein
MTVEEILRSLDSGNFESLVGLVEDFQTEAKGAPYQLSLGDAQKHELAKDVSALANADGGIILLGFRTVKDDLNPIEKIEECRPFESAMVDAEQYRKVLEDWIYPPLHLIQILSYLAPSDKTKCVVAIVVPRTATGEKPFVVTKSILPTGMTRGTLVGYYERVQDRIPPTSPQSIRTQLRDGMRFGELSERLSSIESIVSNMSLPPSPAVSGLSDTDIGNRISKAQTVIERATSPSIVFSATSSNPTSFPRIFHSDSDVVKLIEHSPRLRTQGFDIHVDERSEIINGEARRVSRLGSRVVELWKDGLLLAIGEGDDDLLCWWAGPPRRTPGLRIRNFVLTEVTLNFLNLALEIFKHAEPVPENLIIALSLNNMNESGITCSLSPHPDNRARLPIDVHSASSDAIAVRVSAPFKDIDLGAVAYDLLGQLYTKFGFNYDQMPYLEKTQNGGRITPESWLPNFKADG